MSYWTIVSRISPGAVQIVDIVSTPPHRQPRDIIEAVVANMRRNLERLKYSTLAPSRYTVYLHSAEFERLETIVPVLREQTIRALDEELRRINARPPAPRWKRRKTEEPEPEVRNAATDWHVAFMADPDGELKEGDVVVDSELLMPARPDLGVGGQTRRIAIVQSAPHAATIEHTICRSPASSPSRLRGRLEYDDDSGHHFYDVTTDCFTIAPGVIARPVHVRIASPAEAIA